MSVIAVEGLNLKISLFQVRKMLAKTVQGKFEPLSFVTSDRSPYKTCYMQLSDKLDPLEVIERINNVVHGKKKSVLNAYIPDNIPNFIVLPSKLRKKLGVSRGDIAAAQVLSIAHMEIMTELQYKYTGLYNLSSKGSHTLLEAIGMTIHDRLKQLVASGVEESSNPFLVTGRYRKAHPHFGDFQLILGTLHRLEDAAGSPRTQLQESALTVTPKDISVVDNVPYNKAQEAVSKYTERILKKLEEHVGSYELTPSPEDSKEVEARKKVQTQLSKMMPYLPSIMKQVVMGHFTDDYRKHKFHKMRMYGEPCLPPKELNLPLMKRYCAQRVSRWKFMFNLLVFDVPLQNYSKIITLDGTTLGGSKITIRSSDANIYHVTLSKKKTGDSPVIDDEEEDYAMEQ